VIDPFHPSDDGSLPVPAAPLLKTTPQKRCGWRLIRRGASCEKNSEGIKREGMLFRTRNLEECQRSCLLGKHLKYRNSKHSGTADGCVAVDFLALNGWCNLYKKPCRKPLNVHPKWSSYRYACLQVNHHSATLRTPPGKQRPPL